MAEQKIISSDNNYLGLDSYLVEKNCRTVFLVCGSSIGKLNIGKYFDELDSRLHINVCRFSAFHPNPDYESVCEGVRMFRLSGAEMIIAVGGGSAIDVAKCIKLFATMNDKENYLQQAIEPNAITLVAIPTTAGTGSETTRYAVVYYKGEKQSVNHYSCIPHAIMFDKNVLDTLPYRVKGATMLDALSHAVESFWSVNSTVESKKYAQMAITLILNNKNRYLQNDKQVYESMLQAAYYAGKAIDITQTTAGHAMCYKLTSLFGIQHGFAVAKCICVLWPYMQEHIEKCRDKRGEKYLEEMFNQLANAFGCSSAKKAIELFESIVECFNIDLSAMNEENVEKMTGSVNVERLNNNPILLEQKDIALLYRRMMGE